MRAIDDMPSAVARDLRAVFFDIDDTITTGGQLGARAYQAIEDLAQAGIATVPVTGRPAGWCDMIARLWPVDGVIGENGAFYYACDRAAHRMIRHLHPCAAPHIARADRFDRICARIAAEVPGAALSADQKFRQADLAVDFAEDVPRLDDVQIATITKIFAEEGAMAKVSSIHVNGWFGTYDKLATARSFARDILSLDIDADNRQIVFVGDSPNDAPMFGFFVHSCGVANVRDFASQLDAPPKWVARQRCGEGFREIADHILKSRG